jgi:hypothetical protein
LWNNILLHAQLVFQDNFELYRTCYEAIIFFMNNLIWKCGENPRYIFFMYIQCESVRRVFHENKMFNFQELPWLQSAQGCESQFTSCLVLIMTVSRNARIFCHQRSTKKYFAKQRCICRNIAVLFWQRWCRINLELKYLFGFEAICEVSLRIIGHQGPQKGDTYVIHEKPKVENKIKLARLSLYGTDTAHSESSGPSRPKWGLLNRSEARYFYKRLKTSLHKPTGNLLENPVSRKCAFKNNV